MLNESSAKQLVHVELRGMIQQSSRNNNQEDDDVWVVRAVYDRVCWACHIYLESVMEGGRIFGTWHGMRAGFLPLIVRSWLWWWSMILVEIKRLITKLYILMKHSVNPGIWTTTTTSEALMRRISTSYSRPCSPIIRRGCLGLRLWLWERTWTPWRCRSLGGRSSTSGRT